MHTKIIDVKDDAVFSEGYGQIKPRLMYNRIRPDTGTIATVDKFTRDIWNCGFEPRLERFSEAKAYLYHSAHFFSAITFPVSLLNLAYSLICYSENSVLYIAVQAALFFLSAVGLALSCARSKESSLSQEFYRENRLLREQNNPLALLNIAEGGAVYEHNLLMLETEVAVVQDFLVHEAVHLLKGKGVTSAESDLYLATAVSSYFSYITRGSFKPVSFNFCYDNGKSYAESFMKHGSDAVFSYSLRKYLDTIDQCNAGSIVEEEHRCYLAGLFLAGVINRLHEEGVQQDSLAKTFRLLGNGMNLMESLRYSVGTSFSPGPGFSPDLAQTPQNSSSSPQNTG